ncbi:MAG: phosphodiester glycosidase family protein [Proteobacteria bacterium]|nr:phosphodiester glycosidase family protein [Pseudomonadota bacterium]
MPLLNRLKARLAIFIGAGLALASPAAANAPCARQSLQGRTVIVCTVDLTRQTLRTYWKASDGKPYGSLAGIAARAENRPGPMLFAMNAGMYHEDMRPVGLYVEAGQTQTKANTVAGPGNFHMRPNGVFYVSGATAGVMETRRFLASRLKADYASQSGPMLVVDGKFHPQITGRGTSAKIRNGVGVRSATSAVFIITDEPVTFSEFARMFRDDLKCRNALYFDGSISSIYAPSVGRSDSFMRVGPIVAAFSR